jgi:hypothetical protein
VRATAHRVRLPDSIVFVDKGNVFSAHPDGMGLRTITTPSAQER